jgi:hypothetical protein
MGKERVKQQSVEEILILLFFAWSAEGGCFFSLHRICTQNNFADGKILLYLTVRVGILSCMLNSNGILLYLTVRVGILSCMLNSNGILLYLTVCVEILS